MSEDLFIAFEDLPLEVQAASNVVREESRRAAERLEVEIERLESLAALKALGVEIGVNNEPTEPSAND